MTDYDELVRRLVLMRWRDEQPRWTVPNETHDHLVKCENVVVTDTDAHDGSYGCDTGCEYVWFEAMISCPHVPDPVEYRWGNFGELTDLIEDLEKLEDGGV